MKFDKLGVGVGGVGSGKHVIAAESMKMLIATTVCPLIKRH